MKTNKKHKIKHDFDIEISIVQLVNKFFWKSKIGPIGSLVLPLSFMIIYKIMSFLNGQENIEIFTSGLPSYLTLAIVPIALITLPQIIVELKNSIILRKISISQVSSLKFSLLVIGYIALGQSCSYAIVILFYLAMLNKDIHHALYMDWTQAGFAYLYTSLLSLTLGYFFGVFFKKVNLPPLIGFIVLLLSATLAGQFVPLSVIAQSQACRIVSLFSPLTYPMNLFNNLGMEKPPWPTFVNDLEDTIENEAFQQAIINALKDEYANFNSGTSIFDLTHPAQIMKVKPLNLTVNKDMIEAIVVYPVWQKILNLVMPVVFSITFFSIALKKFNWTSR